MKKITIILSTLMVMALSNGIVYAEQGDGKPLEMSKIEVSMQEKKVIGEKKETKQMETKQEAAHRYARERSEER
ncbi:hypothetical protein [Fusobacterium sp. THCT1E2]